MLTFAKPRAGLKTSPILPVNPVQCFLDKLPSYVGLRLSNVRGIHSKAWHMLPSF